MQGRLPTITWLAHVERVVGLDIHIPCHASSRHCMMSARQSLEIIDTCPLPFPSLRINQTCQHLTGLLRSQIKHGSNSSWHRPHQDPGGPSAYRGRVQPHRSAKSCNADFRCHRSHDHTGIHLCRDKTEFHCLFRPENSLG